MRISVIIPVFNAAKYVKDAVKSALDQEEVGEIIIVEDGSTDKSLEICRELCQFSQKVKLIQHEKQENLGASASRNLGIRKAQHELIAFLDADDLYCENRFQYSFPHFVAHPEVDMVYEPGGALNKVPLKSNDFIYFEKAIDQLSEFECYFLQANGWTMLNTTMFRKRAFDKIGRFDNELRQTQDTDLLLRAFQNLKSRGINTGSPVALFRNHDARRSTNKEEARKYKKFLYQKWLPIIISGNHNPLFLRRFLNHYVYYCRESIYQEKNTTLRKAKKILAVSEIVLRNPKLLLKIL